MAPGAIERYHGASCTNHVQAVEAEARFVQVKERCGTNEMSVGDRIRALRQERAWTQEELAARADISPEYLSRIETGDRTPGDRALKGLAEALGVGVEALTSDHQVWHPSSIPETNPKPVRLGDLRLDDAYLALGNHTEPVEITVRYTHERLKLPPEIQAVYSKLAETARRRAEAGGHLYFNGPNTRLTRVSLENNRQLPSGTESHSWVLELGPVSWEEYTVLNAFLDERVFDPPEDTIRKRFAKVEKLYENAANLTWCPLSNILCLALIPITMDGYGIIQQRSKTIVSVDGGRFTSGVAENIHRFMDEAVPENLGRRKNPADPVGGLQSIDHLYRPTGVPSPLLAAQRGVKEELSEGLYHLLKDAPERFKFLNLLVPIDRFHPELIGVIDLPFTLEETKALIEESPGKDHPEAMSIRYVPLDPTANATAEVMRDRSKWTVGGLAALISAIQYRREWARRKASEDGA
jgi:transcriptional regulator with XRE-family HTH domain/endonuclease V-like protein UPF0215 family